MNGFEDDDGCPDEPKRLAMVAAEAERERREAEVNSVHSLESLGAAHYVPGVGFILSGPSADAPASGSDAVEPSLRVPYGARLDRTSFHFGLDGGYRHWSDPTGANTLFDFDGFGVGCSLRFESRAIGRLWTLWSDAHFSGTFAMGPTMTVAGGGAQISNTSGSQVEILNITGHVGLDVQPFDLIGVGPFVGYRVDFIDVAWQGNIGPYSGRTDTTSSDMGPEFGLHARIRTREAPRAHSIFYADGEIFSRQGSVMTGVYQRDEIGFCTPAGLCAYVDAEIRLDTSGAPGPGAIQSPADALAKTPSMDEWFGGGFTLGM